MKVQCPDCGYTRLRLREYGTYVDSTPINEEGRVLTDHRHADTSPVRTKYDVWCPVCGAIVPATLIGSHITLFIGHEFVNVAGDIEDDTTGATRAMTPAERAAWEGR